MPPVPPMKLSALGFAAGFLATLIFHQSVWAALHAAGIVAPEFTPWRLDPVLPFGLPSVISLAFWGGVWGAALAIAFARQHGASYWTAWIVIGALAPSLVAMYVVLPLKGLPIPELWPRLGIACSVNAAWAFGTALILRILAVGRA
jgi:hypothetical protein